MAIADQPALATQVIDQPAAVDAPAVRWNLATRIAFRFCFCYFGLYIVLTQMLTSLLFATTNDSGAWELDNMRPIQAVVVWVASHVFHAAQPVVTFETGSGDRVYDWVELACILALAIIATLVWSALDRKRQSYPKLYAWFRVFIRFSLAATMLTYGAAKAIPLQMPFPDLRRLVEPYGNLSPMGVLWASIGASQAYEIFAGCAELFGGILLIFPRTTTLGVLVCLADATQVFMLNMTYDVPVKLLSFHMILCSLLLLAPEAKRLANVFFLDRAASPSSAPPLFRRARANRIALVVQILFGLFLIGANLYGALNTLKTYPYIAAATAKVPLYGIWNVEQFTVDGQPRPPLLTDATRWRRLIFEFPELVSIQNMNEDRGAFYTAKIDLTAKLLALTKSSDKKWKADFTFAQPSPAEMVLDGSMDGHKVHAQMQLFDRSKFLLVTRGFHWIQDHPFNR